ncbi:MAG: 2-hydroxycyclohexanecarboxyl-CoA dehydrogenase [Deltaproteobacteria bacterium]|nr:2-hydroxycyclohexanecarboxyl-CoA dehydrogenase [Deltaproteobacteria bacterium]
MRGLEGGRVLLTGGAQGIGRATALRLAEEGMHVAILDRDGEGAQDTAARIHAAGGSAEARVVDISQGSQVEAAVASVWEAGPIDGLVNNAGWDRAAPFLETDAELWRQVIEINLYGPLHVSHAVLRRMAERGRGRVVSITSDAGRVGSSGEAVYAACKGGVAAFSKSVARELARSGITLNVVAPGPTDTQLFADFDASGKLAPALARAIPMGRLGQPEDYPGLVAFLLSDDAAFVTGQTISVSGGLTMHG